MWCRFPPWLLLLAPLLAVDAGGAHGQATPSPDAAQKAALDRLLDALKAAPTEEEAAAIELRIQQTWLSQGSPAVTLLVARGMRDLQAGANDEAVGDFDAVIALDDGMAEAWHRRAIARFAAGDSRGAVADIEQTMLRDPRNFAALRTLSRIAESRQDWKGAYAAWLKLLELDPKTPGGQEKLKDLKRRALGEAA
jgi:tetratricopeptide (TPR) repeat protein